MSPPDPTTEQELGLFGCHKSHKTKAGISRSMRLYSSCMHLWWRTRPRSGIWFAPLNKCQIIAAIFDTPNESTFIARQQPIHALLRQIRSFVRPSVCLFNAGIVSKGMRISSQFFDDLVEASSFLVPDAVTIFQGNPLSGGFKYTRGGKIVQLSFFLISEKVEIRPLLLWTTSIGSHR